MKNVKQALSTVYKANQCLDFNDVDIAMNQCFELKHIFGIDNKMINRRIVSLKNRKEKLGW